MFTAPRVIRGWIFKMSDTPVIYINTPSGKVVPRAPAALSMAHLTTPLDIESINVEKTFALDFLQQKSIERAAEHILSANDITPLEAYCRLKVANALSINMQEWHLYPMSDFENLDAQQLATEIEDLANRYSSFALEIFNDAKVALTHQAVNFELSSDLTDWDCNTLVNISGEFEKQHEDHAHKYQYNHKECNWAKTIKGSNQIVEYVDAQDSGAPIMSIIKEA